VSRVLFVCTHNSARSQMAEALLRSMAPETFEVHSAGTEAGSLHPLAVEAMREVGIDISGQEAKPVSRYEGGQFDYVITVCDEAREACPVFPGSPRTLHWSLPDPSRATGSAEERLNAFRETRDRLTALIAEFVKRSGAMTRTAFDKQLSEIEEDMLVLASMVERAIDRSIEALKNRDVELARSVIADDMDINRKRYEIEEKCLELLATQQPLARDLRTIVAVLHVIVDLERMGDHAEGTAKVAIMLADEPPLKPYIDIPRMAQVASEMLRDSIEAFKLRDVSKARSVCDRDDEVDALYDQVYRELLTYMLNDPKTIERATHITWIAHNLERIADRVTNICERVVYMVQGTYEELNVSKY